MDNDVITLEECISRLDIIRNELVPNSRDHFALSAGIAALHEMERGHTVNRWVSCNDRLPEKQGRYLVSLESGQIAIREFLFSLTYGVEPYFSGCEKVIAWMPMPDAYESPEVNHA